MGREILIGVTGGIAAYKTAALVSQLAQSGAGVTVIMTESAKQFVGPATFEALTGRPVPTEMFGDPAFPLGAHIELARPRRSPLRRARHRELPRQGRRWLG